MVVDADPGLPALGILIGSGRKRLQGWTVDVFVKTPTAAFHLLELAIVEFLELFGNGPVQLLDAEECVVPERRQYPSFCYENRRFHLGLILWFESTGRDDNGT